MIGVTVGSTVREFSFVMDTPPAGDACVGVTVRDFDLKVLWR